MIRLLFIASIKNSIIHSYDNPKIYNINLKYIDHSRPTLEHIFPRCYMNKKSHHDLHNIFSCNSIINNNRSNYKFIDNSEINNYPSNTFININDNYLSHKYKVFVPENESKGIISRTIMYMSYTYKYRYDKIIDYENLINWCLMYPPTKEEINHNNIVFKKQYNRNKFIDLYQKKNYYKYILNLFK